MKAWVHEKYGDAGVMEIREVDKPSPGTNEVRLAVRAASINVADWYMLNGRPFVVRFMAGGLFRPSLRIIGSDVAGVIDAVGSGVKNFKPGDEVYADIALTKYGSMAEYAIAPENIVSKKPSNLSFEESAAIPLAGVTALKAVRDVCRLQNGQHLLINGASGGVGTFAIQIAKAYGAVVTAVVSSRNAQVAEALGADYILDYTKEDFATSGTLYDVILAANGERKLSDYKNSLQPGGIYACSGGTMKQIFQSMLLGPVCFAGSKKQVKVVSAKANANDLFALKTLAEQGKLNPRLDKIFSFDKGKEAMAYLGEGHAKGKIVISLSP